MSQKPRLLSSLILVEEKLLETEYFVLRLDECDGNNFQYELNAYLSAARGVTFLLQKELAHVPGFPEWWEVKRERLREDKSARFFVELRNFSQKKGRISLVGVLLPRGAGTDRWCYRFAGTEERVPDALLQRNAVDCCEEHLGKLATIILDCTEAFPYHCCPKHALSPEGLEALGLELDQVDVAAGFPHGWSSVGDESDRLVRIARYSDYVDGLDFDVLRRLAQLASHRKDRPTPDALNDELLTAMVNQIERRSDAEQGDVLLRVALFGALPVEKE